MSPPRSRALVYTTAVEHDTTYYMEPIGLSPRGLHSVVGLAAMLEVADAPRNEGRHNAPGSWPASPDDPRC